MKASPTPLRRVATAVHFRSEIEKAAAEGVAPEDMVLRLTVGDATHLKRDRTLPVADLSFADGEMRFLGVRVEQGGVAESVLSRP